MKPPTDPGNTDPVLAIPDPKPALTYPEGPYGKTKGATEANLVWSGYRNGTGDWGEISLLDYYDPDGSKGIKAIKINLAATW